MSAPASAADLKGRVLELLASVAPDVDIHAVRPELEFREQFDFDSMDVFNFAAALHAAFGLDIPERDYRQLLSLNGCIAYLGKQLGTGKSAQ
jgi:acyl carrier protein